MKRRLTLVGITIIGLSAIGATDASAAISCDFYDTLLDCFCASNPQVPFCR